MNQYEYVYTHGKKLYARIFNSETKVTTLFSDFKDNYTPELFIPTKEESKYKSHYNNNLNLKQVNFSTIKDMNNYIDENSNFIKIHGNKSVQMKFIRDKFHNTIESNHDFRVHYIDIETRSINGFPDTANPIEPVSLIQVYDSFEEVYFVFGTKEYINTKTFLFGKVVYVYCTDEIDILNKYTALVQKTDPAIITGFNCFIFDFPYIINRMKKVKLDPCRLSPIGVITEKEAESKDGIAYIHYNIIGRILLDYRELYLKYSFAKLPKHNLETIATHELGEGKIGHDEYISFEEFYKADFQKFVEYGIKDVEILVSLEKKLKFIDTAKFMAYTCGVNVDDVMGTYKQWLSIAYNTALDNGEVLPLEQQFRNENDTFIGGWVLSKPGKYEWVVSFDFASLYPSIIRLLNLGVDTLVKENEMPEELIELRNKYFFWYNDPKNEEISKALNNNMFEFEHIKFLMDNKEHIHSILEKYNVCASPNGYFYRKDKEGVIPSLMKKIYNERRVNKKLAEQYKNEYAANQLEETKFLADMYEIYQNSLKIMINSAYGSLSMEINAFSHGKGYSNAVTTGGRLSNRWCNYCINEGINNISKEYKNTSTLPYTSQADTDSVEGNTIISVNNEDMSIAEFFNSVSSPEIVSENGTIVKNVTDKITPSVNAELQLGYNKITQVIKHKVKKKMFKVTVGDESVVITEDHSIMIVRNGLLISAKAQDIRDGDKIVKIIRN